MAVRHHREEAPQHVWRDVTPQPHQVAFHAGFEEVPAPHAVFRLKLEQAESVVQADDLRVFALLLRRERSGGTLLSDFLDTRRQVAAHGV